MQHHDHRTAVALDKHLDAVDLGGAQFSRLTLDCHGQRSKISFMERPSLAAMSVPADDTAEFLRAELAAFVEVSKRDRPTAWRRVEQLQRVCRSESPAAAGPALAAKAFEPSERASSGVTMDSGARASAWRKETLR